MHWYLLNELLRNILSSMKITFKKCVVACDITLPPALPEVNIMSVFLLLRYNFNVNYMSALTADSGLLSRRGKESRFYVGEKFTS